MYYPLVPKEPGPNLRFRHRLLELGSSSRSAAEILWLMCARDPLFYINTFCWTYDPRPKKGLSGQQTPHTIPFNTYPYQDEVFREIFEALGVEDAAAEKSRDMGASWMFLLAVSLACLVWLTLVVRKLMNSAAPELAHEIEGRGPPVPVTLRVLCPVHDVEARVRIVATVGTSEATLGGCSLHPDQSDGVPCEGQCIIRDEAPFGAKVK